jgi:AraC-like DNA-binding protein/mannose-6-phosphate isomerase-like protein (cupin superfamily)
MQRLNRHVDDSLSQLLRVVNVHSSVYCLSDLRAPWGFHVEDSTVAKFHLPLEGSGVLTLDSGEQLDLERGELVMLPFGRGHTVRDRLRPVEVLSLEQILREHPVDGGARLRYGGRGRRTLLVCGGFALTDALPARLLAVLPPVVKLDARAGGWVEPLLDVLCQAADDGAPGASAVFAKIADVFLTQALRGYLLSAERAGLVQVAPLQQPSIARAIELMRNHAEQPWSIARLAQDVGMSRTLFSARFRSLVGQSPMRFLARLRISQAAGSLATTNDTLYAIAHRAGYESEASFSKAFRREFGTSPGAYRRQSIEQPVVVQSVAS